MFTTFVRVSIIVAQMVVAAVLFGIFAHARWYASIAFGTAVTLGLWGFEVWQRDLVRRAAWLAIRTLILESQEIEMFKAAYSSHKLEQVAAVSASIQAAIRRLD